MPLYGSFRYGQQKYGASSTDDNLHWIISIDWNGDGTFDGTNEGARCVDMDIERGRQWYIKVGQDGDAQGFEHVQPGRASFMLDNSNGRYDPYNTSSPIYPYVKPGRYVEIRLVDGLGGTDYDVFAGRISSITPERMPGGQNYVRIDCVDGLSMLNKADSSIAIQTNISIDAAIGLVLDDVNYPTIWGRNLEVSDDDLNYWWGNRKASTEIFDLSDAELLGNFFVANDGAATFYSRAHTDSAVISLTQDELLEDIVLPYPWEVVRNEIKVVAHPRIDQATGILWTLQDKPLIAAGESLTIWAQYQFDNRYVPAINVAISSSDYAMNTQEDGLGSNTSSDFTVTLTDFGETAKLVFTNTSGSQASYLYLAQVHGQAIDSPDPVYSISESTSSQATYDKLSLTIDTRWLQSSSLAADFSAYLLTFLSTPQAFLTVQLENRPSYQFAPDLFDVVNMVISKLGLSANFKVGHIKHKWLSANGQAVLTTFRLEPFPDNSIYWRFDATMGVTTVFGL